MQKTQGGQDNQEAEDGAQCFPQEFVETTKELQLELHFVNLPETREALLLSYRSLGIDMNGGDFNGAGDIKITSKQSRHITGSVQIRSLRPLSP